MSTSPLDEIRALIVEARRIASSPLTPGERVAWATDAEPKWIQSAENLVSYLSAYETRSQEVLKLAIELLIATDPLLSGPLKLFEDRKFRRAHDALKKCIENPK